MHDLIVEFEPHVRLSAFLGVFVLVALWEIAAPRRALRASKAVRWTSNIGIVVLDTALVRLVFPAAAAGVAAVVGSLGWGLFNVLAWPMWVEVLLAVIVLDLVIYWQHAMFHAVPGLWRLHMVHHADLDIDVTTGVRFHPFEILLSMAIKMAAITALGAAPLAVILFEIALGATSIFNHGNVVLPPALDRLLRLVVVTPDMHRVHHSVVADETNSNFGFNLPWWDRLFGTYRAQPAAGHERMTIGLEQFRDPRRQWLWHMLALPFTGAGGGYSRGWRRGD
ncbi:MAG: sterol desaturase family protein [Chromatiales bacterium]|nr:sterol desaturase family protein [Chromatiales bacterium]